MAMFESRKLIARIREDGYATNERSLHTLTPGKTSGISAPIFEDGKLAATLTLSFFSSAMRMDEAVRRFVPDVKRVAAEISSALDSRSASVAATVKQVAAVPEKKKNRASGTLKTHSREHLKGATQI
jgi:hypothetical protein